MSALGHKRTFAVQKGMSALPPKADMCGATRDVRFVPIADIALFDHLVGERDERRRDFEAEALAALRLITKSNLAACMTGRSAGLSPFRNCGGVDTSLAIRIGYARPIAHQAACDNELT